MALTAKRLVQNIVFESNGYGRDVNADQLLNVPTPSGGTQRLRASEIAAMPKEAFDEIWQVGHMELCPSASARGMLHRILQMSHCWAVSSVMTCNKAQPTLTRMHESWRLEVVSASQ